MVTRHGDNKKYYSDWYTPRHVIEWIEKVYGGQIDLDVCSDATAQEIVGAKHFFTKSDDGLKQDWFGNVWCNYPGGVTGRVSNSTIWFDAAVKKFNNPDVNAIIFCLFSIEALSLNPRMFDYPICFLRSRIPFVRFDENGVECDSRPGHNNGLLLITDDWQIKERFIDVLSDHGQVVELKRT